MCHKYSCKENNWNILTLKVCHNYLMAWKVCDMCDFEMLLKIKHDISGTIFKVQCIHVHKMN